MKRIKFLVPALLMLLIASCANNRGLLVESHDVNDVIAYGLPTIQEYRPDLDIIAMDSLLDGRQPRFAFMDYDQDLGGDIFQDGQNLNRFYIAQVKTEDFDEPDDFYWVIGVTRAPGGYVIDPSPKFTKVPVEEEMPEKPIAGISPDYNIYGSVIKATKLDGFENMAGYRPVLISIDMATDQELNELVLISYDNTNKKVYELNKISGSAGNEYADTVDYNFGNRFYLRKNPIVGISPEDVKSGRIKLINLGLVENTRVNREVGYVLEMFPRKPKVSRKVKLSCPLSKQLDNGTTVLADYVKNMRYADYDNYSNGAIRMNTLEFCAANPEIAKMFARQGVIGRNPRTGVLQKTFLISPSYLRSIDSELYRKYRNKVFYPIGDNQEEKADLKIDLDIQAPEDSDEDHEIIFFN